MKTSIKIVSGKRGFHLKVNNLFISQGFAPDPIKSIIGDYGIPYGATEWVSIQAIKDFWHKYMPLILLATCHPCTSEWGRIAYLPSDK